MHIRTFAIDLDAPSGIAYELVHIPEAFAERAIATSDIAEEKDREIEGLVDDYEEKLDATTREHEIRQEELGEAIARLEAKVKTMSYVSEEAKAEHRKALNRTMEDLAAMDIIQKGPG